MRWGQVMEGDGRLLTGKLWRNALVTNSMAMDVTERTSDHSTMELLLPEYRLCVTTCQQNDHSACTYMASCGGLLYTAIKCCCCCEYKVQWNTVGSVLWENRLERKSRIKDLHKIQHFLAVSIPR